MNRLAVLFLFGAMVLFIDQSVGLGLSILIPNDPAEPNVCKHKEGDLDIKVAAGETTKLQDCSSAKCTAVGDRLQLDLSRYIGGFIQQKGCTLLNEAATKFPTCAPPDVHCEEGVARMVSR